jgi:hypothetical protein
MTYNDRTLAIASVAILGILAGAGVAVSLYAFVSLPSSADVATRTGERKFTYLFAPSLFMMFWFLFFLGVMSRWTSITAAFALAFPGRRLLFLLVCTTVFGFAIVMQLSNLCTLNERWIKVSSDM